MRLRRQVACVLMLRGLIKTFFGTKTAWRRGKKRACLLCLTSGGVLRCLYRLRRRRVLILNFIIQKTHPAFRPAANAINNIYIFGACRAQNRAQFRYIARIKTGNFQYQDKRDKNFAIFTDKKLTDVKKICNCRLAKKRDK